MMTDWVEPTRAGMRKGELRLQSYCKHGKGRYFIKEKRYHAASLLANKSCKVIPAFHCCLALPHSTVLSLPRPSSLAFCDAVDLVRDLQPWIRARSPGPAGAERIGPQSAGPQDSPAHTGSPLVLRRPPQRRVGMVPQRAGYRVRATRAPEN